jgi:peptide-methionine (S)-S-oxide reductase
MSNHQEIAVFAGGCFWCTEAIFKELRGVDSVIPGYTGGIVASPSYEEVCTGTTDHAEAVKITFDPQVISYQTLLEIFFSTHDPTTLNCQGHDQGTQYRSAIFATSDKQFQQANQVKTSIEKSHVFDQLLVTEIEYLDEFYPAEADHHDYFATHPQAGYCQVVIAPKLEKFRSTWEKWRKE